MRRVAAEIRARHRPHLLGRDLREPDAGQDHQRAGQAGRPGGALPRGRAGALRRRLARPGPGDRAEDGDQAAGDGDPHARRPARAGARRARSAPSARARAPGCTPAAGSGTRPRSRSSRETKSQSVETTFDVDVARAGGARVATSPSRPRSSAAACASASSRGARSGSRSGSTTGPTSPARTRSRSRPTTRTWSRRWRWSCCAPTTRSGRCACSASASPASAATRQSKRSRPADSSNSASQPEFPRFVTHAGRGKRTAER